MKNKKVVYLSGPMRGIPREKIIEQWKETESLLSEYFKVVHPVSGREGMLIPPDPRLIVARDKAFIARADIVLINDTIAEASMIGTGIETYIAHELKKIVIIYGNGHPLDYWLNCHCHLRTQTLEEACEIINKLFVD